MQLSYDLENEIWTVEYKGYINFIIREEATRNEFIEAVKDFEEDPECLLYEVQDIIDEDLRKLTDLYQKETPPTKEELDEISEEILTMRYYLKITLLGVFLFD